MSFFFKKFSLFEVIYLLIRFNKTKSFLRNKEYWYKWCKWAKHTLVHQQRDNFRRDYLVLVSDTHFFRTTPLFTTPSLFMGKIYPHIFWENSENSTPPPPPFKGRGGEVQLWGHYIGANLFSDKAFQKNRQNNIWLGLMLNYSFDCVCTPLGVCGEWINLFTIFLLQRQLTNSLIICSF